MAFLYIKKFKSIKCVKVKGLSFGNKKEYTFVSVLSISQGFEQPKAVDLYDVIWDSALELGSWMNVFYWQEAPKQEPSCVMISSGNPDDVVIDSLQQIWYWVSSDSCSTQGFRICFSLILCFVWHWFRFLLWLSTIFRLVSLYPNT